MELLVLYVLISATSASYNPGHGLTVGSQHELFLEGSDDLKHPTQNTIPDILQHKLGINHLSQFTQSGNIPYGTDKGLLGLQSLLGGLGGLGGLLNPLLSILSTKHKQEDSSEDCGSTCNNDPTEEMQSMTSLCGDSCDNNDNGHVSCSNKEECGNSAQEPDSEIAEDCSNNCNDIDSSNADSAYSNSDELDGSMKEDNCELCDNEAVATNPGEDYSEWGQGSSLIGIDLSLLNGQELPILDKETDTERGNDELSDEGTMCTANSESPSEDLSSGSDADTTQADDSGSLIYLNADILNPKMKSESTSSLVNNDQIEKDIKKYHHNIVMRQLDGNDMDSILNANVSVLNSGGKSRLYNLYYDTVDPEHTNFRLKRSSNPQSVAMEGQNPIFNKIGMRRINIETDISDIDHIKHKVHLRKNPITLDDKHLHPYSLKNNANINLYKEYIFRMLKPQYRNQNLPFPLKTNIYRELSKRSLIYEKLREFELPHNRYFPQSVASSDLYGSFASAQSVPFGYRLPLNEEEEEVEGGEGQEEEQVGETIEEEEPDELGEEVVMNE